MYTDLDHAYEEVMCEVQRKMGQATFSRLESAGLAAERRLAAYFIGVRCGRMMPPRTAA